MAKRARHRMKATLSLDAVLLQKLEAYADENEQFPSHVVDAALAAYLKDWRPKNDTDEQ